MVPTNTRGLTIWSLPATQSMYTRSPAVTSISTVCGPGPERPLNRASCGPYVSPLYVVNAGEADVTKDPVVTPSMITSNAPGCELCAMYATYTLVPVTWNDFVEPAVRPHRPMP